MWPRMKQMLVKEFLQVFRDKRMRFVLFLPPIVQMLVFGYAANYEIRSVPIAVLDLDRSFESRDVLSRFTASPYFVIRGHLSNERDIAQWIDRSEVALALQIHPGFAQRLRKGETAPLQVIVDGTNSNTALIALGYLNQIAGRFASDYQINRLQRLSPLQAAQVPEIVVQRRPWYNPDLQSRWFFVPGVIGSLTSVMVVVLTAFAIVREREIGTLEQIMVTPIRAWEFVFGKTLPFFLIGVADAVLVAAVGTFWFEVPFRGDLGVLFLGTVLFVICMLGVGLLTSTISATQQQAMVSSFFFLMPAITFSGFGFPISSMPDFVQWLTYLDPLRYFLVILRGTYLKGMGLEILWPQMGALAVMAAGLLAISVTRFRKSLD